MIKTALGRQLALAGLVLSLCGCADTFPTNPFLTLTETFPPTGLGRDPNLGGGGGAGQAQPFREDISLTFRNNHPDAELNTTFIAWVNVSSITTADQQDVLFANGFTQLNREIRVGTAITLPVGTFVFAGPGTAGATDILLGPLEQSEDDPLPTSETFELITPDGILVFEQPPVSCESVAFFFSDQGEPITITGFKTLAEVDAYTCDPFRPGFYLRSGGGQPEPYEYLIGESIAIDFFPNPTADGDFAQVTIARDTTTTTP